MLRGTNQSIQRLNHFSGKWNFHFDTESQFYPHPNDLVKLFMQDLNEIR